MTFKPGITIFHVSLNLEYISMQSFPPTPSTVNYLGGYHFGGWGRLSESMNLDRQKLDFLVLLNLNEK